MNISKRFEQINRDCKLGIKAFQNIHAASLGFAKMLELATTNDPILMPSVFHWAVIRYVKPFLESKFEGTGPVRYSIKHLKGVEGYSTPIHDHLILIRHTLVAHDDFVEIPPRILTCGMNSKEGGWYIPTSIVASNKCVAFPKDPAVVEKMYLHSMACLNGVHTKLMNDMEALRDLTIAEPQHALAGAKYTKDYGELKIEPGGTTAQLPNYSNDEWLNVPEPDYSALHNGYQYENARVNRDFPGPEQISLPGGEEVLGDKTISSNQL